MSISNTRIRLQKPFLIITALTLMPIALTYGFAPEGTLHYLYGIQTQVNDPAITHILRALMGLYLGMAVFWVVGAFKSRLRFPALYSLVVFMIGVALGRLFSFGFDGFAHWIFGFFFVSEIVLAGVGIWLIGAIKK